jgi:hypothetical protein
MWLFMAGSIPVLSTIIQLEPHAFPGPCNAAFNLRSPFVLAVAALLHGPAAQQHAEKSTGNGETQGGQCQGADIGAQPTAQNSIGGPAHGCQVDKNNT